MQPALRLAKRVVDLLNDGTGRSFSESPALDGIVLPGDGTTNGANGLDLDGDLDIDLVLHQMTGVVVLRNDGESFSDATATFGIDDPGLISK